MTNVPIRNVSGIDPFAIVLSPKQSLWIHTRRRGGAALFAGGLAVCSLALYQPAEPPSPMVLTNATTGDTSGGASGDTSGGASGDTSGGTSLTSRLRYIDLSGLAERRIAA
jgi:hypothetical protein